LISVLNNVYLLPLSVCNNSQINTAKKIPAWEGIKGWVKNLSPCKRGAVGFLSFKTQPNLKHS